MRPTGTTKLGKLSLGLGNASGDASSFERTSEVQNARCDTHW
jgi:hypothetical protein